MHTLIELKNGGMDYFGLIDSARQAASNYLQLVKNKQAVGSGSADRDDALLMREESEENDQTASS